jgi:hypothetical protein
MIRFRHAVQLSLFLFGLFIVFHLTIIVGIVLFDFVPTDYLWGGRMETREQLLGFEIISLLIMVFCLFVVLIRSERIKWPALKGASKVALWIMFVLFTLNTIGNLLAQSTFEKFFAIITAILALLCLRLAMSRRKSSKN